MIELTHYTLGFVIYMAFNVITFETYSKQNGTTNKFVLGFIYIFYTILMGYVINLVDYNPFTNNIIEIIMQIAIYALAAALFLIIYYNNVIKSKDQELMSNSITRM